MCNPLYIIANNNIITLYDNQELLRYSWIGHYFSLVITCEIRDCDSKDFQTMIDEVII
jgi:hypothetical protein